MGPYSNSSISLISLPSLIGSNASYWAVAVGIAIPLFTIYFTLKSKDGVKRKYFLMADVVAEKPLPKDGSVIVSKIFIHPIKSCRGLSLSNANYTPEGLENDRLWSIFDATKKTIVTARDVPKMVLIVPTIVDDGTLLISFPKDSGCESFSIPLKPDEETLKTWECMHDLSLWGTSIDGFVCEAVSGPKGTASGILSTYFEKPVHLLFKGPRPRVIEPTSDFPNLQATAKYQDMYPLLVLSEESTDLIEKELQGYVGTQGIEERWKTDKVVIERFRPNIVVKGGGPFAEDDWGTITIGERDETPEISLVSRCTRCLLPNVDPQTGERDKAVPYKALMKFRTGLDPTNKMKPCVGCNGVPAANGSLRVGDTVFVGKMRL